MILLDTDKSNSPEKGRKKGRDDKEEEKHEQNEEDDSLRQLLQELKDALPDAEKEREEEEIEKRKSKKKRALDDDDDSDDGIVPFGPAGFKKVDQVTGELKFYDNQAKETTLDLLMAQSQTAFLAEEGRKVKLPPMTQMVP